MNTYFLQASDLFEPDHSSSILLIASIVAVILFLVVAFAVLKLPQINRYMKAQLKINALRAKQEGVSKEEIIKILKEADQSMFLNTDFEL